MAEKTKSVTKEISFAELIAKSIESDGFHDTYANYAQITITNNELFIDFYYVRQNPKGSVQAQHAQRMILPHSLGKGLTNALANIITSFEEENGIVLPNSRQKQSDDKVEIWPPS
jgi:hypothetical protein